jgi:nucleotide-binding universal stress UspA family protein
MTSRPQGWVEMREGEMSMRRYRTVVAYINGTAEDERAVATAAGIASASDGHLILLCPYEKVSTPDVAATAEMLKGEAFLLHGSFVIDNALHAARERAASYGARRITARAEPGLAKKALLAVAEEVGADLVVIGGRGGWWTHQPFGGLAGAIVRSSPVDVLVAAGPDRRRPASRRADSVPAAVVAWPGCWLRRGVAFGM